MDRRLAAERLDRSRGARAPALRDVEDDAHAPVGAGDAAGAHQAERVGELEALAGLEGEHAAAEQDPGVELVGRQADRDVVDAAEAGAGGGARVGLGVDDEVGRGEAVAAERARHEMDQHAARRAHRRQAQLAAAERAVEARREERGGARDRARGVVGEEAQGAHARPLLGEALARVGAGLGVDDEMDAGLAGNSVACFERWRPTRAKPSWLSMRAERSAAASSTPNSMKAKPPSVVACGGSASSTRRERGARLGLGARQPAARLALEVEQRAHRVDRGAPVRRLAEHVVEDLERERAAVARAQHLLEEGRDVELALAGEVAEVARPLQHVHGEQRRVGHLHEEDALARDRRRSPPGRRRATGCGSCRGSGRGAGGSARATICQASR